MAQEWFTDSTSYTNNAPANNDSIACIITRSTTSTCLTTMVANSNVLRMSVQNCGAQLVSGNAFLKDNFVEVGIGTCGNFGSSVVAPTGYHPRGAGAASVASQLGFVADTSKSCWTKYVGDYFLPGTPEEGFGVSINGSSYKNFNLCGTNTITGSIVDVRTTNSENSATWQGAVGGLTVTAKTYIPDGAIYFVTSWQRVQQQHALRLYRPGAQHPDIEAEHRNRCQHIQQYMENGTLVKVSSEATMLLTGLLSKMRKIKK